MRNVPFGRPRRFTGARRRLPRSVFTRLPLTLTVADFSPLRSRMRNERRLTHLRELRSPAAAPPARGGPPRPAGCGAGAPLAALKGVVPFGPLPVGPACSPSTGIVSALALAGSTLTDTGPAKLLPW